MTSKTKLMAEQIPLSRLHEFKDHPYRVMENEELDALAESIVQHGILSPLIVRPMDDKPGEYEIISGHRRVRAAEKAGLETVPAFICKEKAPAVLVVPKSFSYAEKIILLC